MWHERKAVWGFNLNWCSLITAKSEPEESSCVTSNDAVEDAQQMKRELLEQLEKLAEDLPPNTLDELIDELGGPENVAEVGVNNKSLRWRL